MNSNIIVLTSILALLQTGIVTGIVGGRSAQRGEFKNAVALQVLVMGLYETFCGGTIATKQWIVTAGTCILEMQAMVNPLRDVIVVAGTLSVRGCNSNGQGIYKFDIGMIKVHGEGFVDNENLAIYPFSTVSFYPTGDGYIAGWGATISLYTTRRNYSDTKRALAVDFIDPVNCILKLKRVYSYNFKQERDNFDTFDWTLCTGPLDEGHSMCTGDAGGPLIYINNEGQSKVVGIMSLKVGRCGQADTPNLYMDISKMVPWIRNIMMNNQFLVTVA